jgi:hypothetical protein
VERALDREAEREQAAQHLDLRVTVQHQQSGGECQAERCAERAAPVGGAGVMDREQNDR